ncbi:MAG: hypothetical protein A3H96_23455 [Acidobacteria bacterium RIFCSPLOWO2_02_FULL_67_36]|nr:MAG: hypothetical protein A3H96_23455 [Acidobacteria bacterium RIFCSPLOWO2_02_FULL_67_36]OFW20508.1 MAG: hypothetical protein A3G21_23065 [Acidobacteria bacterium RIFCSPLOWO2_12_FULL_66_21]
MEVDRSGWSGDGDFTARLMEVIGALPSVRMLKVEDAPASRADSGFSFISNELFVVFTSSSRVVRTRKLGLIPSSTTVAEQSMTIAGLGSVLAGTPDIGEPDYADEGMLQYLRAERIIPPYQTRGYKLVELVRIYEAGTAPRRDG